ncbi:MAG: prolyl oligopeptidase family serine peptidase [Ruminococcus sp.]|nr:prolyl oligopeptidase family serine peptidase [Candidatus Copronaster equi]
MKNTLPLENEINILHNIPISMEYKKNEDFSQWQSSARKKLSELLGMDKFTECDLSVEEEFRKEFDDHTEIKFYFQSEKDYWVPCVLAIPKKTEYKNPPLMICLQGHGTGMHVTLGKALENPDKIEINSGDRNFGLQCIEKGICSLSVEQRNFGERGGNPKPTCHSSSMVALLTGRTIIGARVWDIMKAIDVVAAHYGELFDADKIYCMGNSGGGTATFYAMALETRIKGGMPSCAFCTYEDSIVRQNHCECNYIPNIRNYFDMAEIAGMIAPRPLVVVTGQTDGIFPVEPAKYEFNRLKNTYYSASERPENCVHVIGEQGHRFYAKQAWAEFDRLIKD